MLIAQYAGVGEICPQWEVEAIASGNLTTSGTLYFSFQLQNRAGFNKPSVSDAIAYNAGQKIVVTIPESTRQPGWDILYFILSAGTSSDPSTHVQIARYPGFQYGVGIEPQSVQSTLPATIELSRNSHILLAPSVANLGSLPTGSDRLDGQVRWVTSEGKWYEYRADSSLPLSTDVVAADVGQWVRVGGASTYVSDTRDGVGSDRPIAGINPATTIPTPPYPGQAAGLSKVLPLWEAKYWIYNNGPNELSAGTEFGIELEYNFKRSPNLLSGLFMVKFDGFVGSDGTIRTTNSDGIAFQNLGAYFPWTPKLTTPFVTSDALQSGEAIALSIKPYFAVSELDDGTGAGDPKSLVGVYPVTRSQSGDYNPLGKLFSTPIVYDIGDRYRIVPNLGLTYDILPGTALIGGYDFPQKPRRTFGNLQPNTAGQKVIINGNAAVYVEVPSYTPTASEAIRAIASTESGESVAGSWSSYVAIASVQSAQLTLNYPCDADGYGTVRADYPDVLAENDKGFFNPYSVNVYLQRQDTLEIRRFSGTLVVAGTSQIITITTWTSGTIVPDLPIADTDFSLFAPGVSAIAPSTGGTFPATNYRATFTFVYNGNQISKISHASPPCIVERDGGLDAPTIEINPTTTVLNEGDPPTVTNSGTSSQAYLTFAFPPIPTIEVNPSITVLDEGDPPSVIDTGVGAQSYLTFRFPPIPTIEVNEAIASLPYGTPPSVSDTGIGADIYLTFAFPPPPTIAVNPAITVLDGGDPPTVTNEGTADEIYLTFAFPPPLGTAIYTVSDITALKALDALSTPERVDGLFVIVADIGTGYSSWYFYHAAFVVTEDLPSVVAPDDSVGRWLQFAGSGADSTGINYSDLVVADIAALKALDALSTPERVDGMLIAVADIGENFPSWYLYLSSSAIAEDLPSVISPDDNTGRWLQFEARNTGSSTGGTTIYSVGDVPGLKALNETSTPPRVDGMFVVVEYAGDIYPSWYQYRDFLTTPENVPYAIAPNDDAGRWIQFEAKSNDTLIYTVDNFFTLRDLDENSTPRRINGMFAIVEDIDNGRASFYQYNDSSTISENVPSVITPADDTGRWLQFDSRDAGSGGGDGIYSVGSIDDLKALDELSDPPRTNQMFVVVDDVGTGFASWYQYNESSGLTENIPSIVTPNDNTGRWLQLTSKNSGIFIYGDEPSTGSSQMAIFADNGILKAKDENDAIPYQIAYTDKPQQYIGTQSSSTQSFFSASGSVTADLTSTNKFAIYLAGNVTLSTINPQDAIYTFRVYQDSVGGRTLNFDSTFLKVIGTLNTDPSEVNLIICECDGVELVCVIHG